MTHLFSKKKVRPLLFAESHASDNKVIVHAIEHKCNTQRRLCYTEKTHVTPECNMRNILQRCFIYNLINLYQIRIRSFTIKSIERK